MLVEEVICQYFSTQHPDIALPVQPLRCNVKFVLQTGFRICPRCIDIDLYIRESWDYAFLPFCFDHGCRLVEVNDIGMFWSSHAYNSLRKLRSGEEREETIQLIQYLQYRLKFGQPLDDSSFSGFDRLSIDEVQEIVTLIGAFASYKNLKKPRKIPIKTDVSTAMSVLESSAVSLIDWPENLARTLKNGIPSIINSRQIFEEYGAIHRAIKKELVGSQYDFFKKDYENFLIDQWPDIIDKKSTWFTQEAKQKSEYVSGTEVSKKVGVRLNRIVSWISSGVLEGNVRQLDSGSRQVTLKKDTYTVVGRLLNFSDACSYLGTTKKSMRGILEDGIIATAKKAKKSVWTIQESNIQDFLRRLMENSMGDMTVGDFKTLTHLRRFCTPKNGVRLSEILTEMLADRVSFFYAHGESARLTDNIYMTSVDFKLLIYNPGQTSIPEFAKLIGIKQEVAYHLINMKIIPTTKNGRAGRLITRQAIDEFCDTYIFLSELAEAQGTSSKSLLKIMRAQGINFVSGPTVDNGRQYLLKKSDTGLPIQVRQPQRVV